VIVIHIIIILSHLFYLILAWLHAYLQINEVSIFILALMILLVIVLSVLIMLYLFLASVISHPSMRNMYPTNVMLSISLNLSTYLPHYLLHCSHIYLFGILYLLLSVNYLYLTDLILFIFSILLHYLFYQIIIS
jgi:hypothetical protein